MGNNDSFTEVTSEGWGSRLMNSIKSVLFGILLFLASFIVIWWNEGRAVKTSKGLEEGASQVVNIDFNAVNPANEGHLVHLSGPVKTDEFLTDDEFGIKQNALKLKRTVEMFQWEEDQDSEKKKKVGGSEETTTTYTYNKVWRDHIINSEDFKVQEGHLNPTSFPVSSFESQVNNAQLGQFKLSRSLLSQLNDYQSFPVNDIKTNAHTGAKVINGDIYIGQGNPETPQIGDVRIHYGMVDQGDYSIIARQVSNTFEQFNTSTGTTIEMIEPGVQSAQNMFESAQRQNTLITWAIRAGGYFLMFFGLTLIFKPLVVLADVLPILGNILSMGIALFSGVISFVLSVITIGLAWFAYRPVLATILLAIGAGIFILVYLKRSKKNKLRDTQSA